DASVSSFSPRQPVTARWSPDSTTPCECMALTSIEVRCSTGPVVPWRSSLGEREHRLNTAARRRPKLFQTTSIVPKGPGCVGPAALAWVLFRRKSGGEVDAEPNPQFEVSILTEHDLVDDDPAFHAFASGIEYGYPGSLQGFFRAFATGPDDQILSADTTSHVPVDHEDDGAEHAPLVETGLVGQYRAHPFGQILVVGH